ncbi:MAG TPA: FG-GAP-like repeat-containing protein [Terriglobia bacterium]|nr:FG-GAP-like repeat-containing protein [Terriglobia bacterium]
MLLATLGPCTSVVSAQDYLFGRADFNGAPSASAVAVGDFNDDGIPDVAFALNFGNAQNPAPGLVAVFLGKSDGTFPSTPPHYIESAYPVGNGPYSLTVGDFNGDGNLDIAVANSTDNTVSILLGNGDGTFQPQYTLATGPAPLSITSGDFNHDGKVDLAVTSRDNFTVSIMLGNGDGTFHARVDYATASYPDGVAVGDFNGDGNLDLAVGAISAISILLGNGDGTFSPHADFCASSCGYNIGWDAIAVGDFNLDGKQDVAALGSNGGGIQMFLGNGDGTFATGANYGVGPLLNFSVAVADLNGDGKPDLVVTNEGSPGGYGPAFQSSVSVLLGNGDGTFQPHVDYPTCNSPDGVTTLDVNRDGPPDIIVACGGSTGGVLPLSNTFSVLLGNGDGTFNRGVQSPTGVVNPGQIVAADLNGDGKLDVAGLDISGLTSATGFVLLGKGDGTFQSPLTFPQGTYPANLLVGDFNADGKVDLVYNYSLFPGNGYVSVLLGNGDGTFLSHIDTSLPAFPTAMISGDFNKDGKLDLVVRDSFGNSGIGLLLGNGDGTFQTPVPIGSGLDGSPAAADVNGDGKLDLLIAGSTLTVLLGNGDGTFQAPRTFGSNLLGYIAVGDFNGDGKLDVVVGAWTFIGNGDGTFQGPIRSGANINGAAAVADLNGDGKLDLQINGSVFLGNGDGTFQDARNYAPVLEAGLPSSSVSAVPGDFNNDGATDLAISADYSASVSVLLNTPSVGLSASSLSFGSQLVGTTSAGQPIVLNNPGSMPLMLAGISASGEFAESNICGASLSVGASCQVNVNFAPTVAGPGIGTLVVSDAAPGSPQTVPLAGTGIVPLAGVSPSILIFTSLPVGSASVAQTVTLSNTGTAALTISSVATSGDFAQTNTCGASVAAGASCTISLTFTPTAEGSRTGTLTITDNNNGVASSTQTVALSGTGDGAVVGLAPASVTFSGQLVSSTSAAQTVTLTNSGNVTLAISGVVTSRDYAQTNTCGASVAAGANCTINVTFTPTAAGLRGGTLTITDNAPGSPQTVTLSGMGTDFSVALASGSSNTATVTAGQTATFNLAFSGTAGFSGTVALTCSGAPALATCSVTPNSLALNGTTPANTTVSVTTTARGMLLPQFYVLPPAPGTHEGLPLLIVLLTLATLAGMAWRRRGGRAPLAPTQALAVGLLLMVVLAAALMPGCGGGGTTTPVPQTPGTPAGTYTLDVAGKFTSGTVTTTHDIKLTLTVN